MLVNITVQILFLTGLGYFLRKIGMLDDKIQVALDCHGFMTVSGSFINCASHVSVGSVRPYPLLFL